MGLAAVAVLALLVGGLVAVDLRRGWDVWAEFDAVSSTPARRGLAGSL
jgi:hypothetical protein